ncbi:MAG: IclR family transcriptional regulator [Hyphomicrobiales bacterium]|nr:IclR family transcriptional regulator [Hyphomicrobiales bacterium]
MKNQVLAGEPAAKKNSFPGIASVNHAIWVLIELPPTGGSIGVNELARRTGLHKSTVSRLLSTLEAYQFVQRDQENRRVRLGIGLVALVMPLLGGLDIMRAGKPVLADLAIKTGETALLALWNGREAVIVDQVIGPQAIVHYAWPGKTAPAHTTALGKIFLAYLQIPLNEPSLELKRMTEYTKTDAEALAADIRLCRERGYAINDQENELESCGIAAPVYDFRENIVASLSLAVPKHRFDEKIRVLLAGHILAAARNLSQQLGCGADKLKGMDGM